MTHEDEAIRALRRSIIAKQAVLRDIEEMTLRDLSDWVVANNNGLFDAGEFPAVDDLTDDEELSAREEYEAIAYEILYGA